MNATAPDTQSLRSLVDALAPLDLYAGEGAELYAAATAMDTTGVAQVRRGARRTTGTIVDLAAGSGRFTIPLLGLGRPVVAVDRSPSLIHELDVQARTVGAADRLTTVVADLARWEPTGPIGFAVMGASSVTLLDEMVRARLFRAVAGALAPGTGRFFISTLDPPPDRHQDPVALVPLGTRESGDAVYFYEDPNFGPTTRRTGFLVIEDDAGRPLVERARLHASEVAWLPAATLVAELEAARLIVHDIATTIRTTAASRVAEIELTCGVA
jgi:SAM-dependent methyltransferase